MKIAMDGGSFQQGIAAGIFNTAVGLMNAITRARPDTRFILVADPRLGPVRGDLLKHLSKEPEIVEADVGPAYGLHSRSLTTSNPNIRFEVDGEEVASEIVDGEVNYEGQIPSRSFRIISRSDSPSATGLGPDTRKLGVMIDRIAIQVGNTLIEVKLDHPWLNRGFHADEGGRRWTDGAADIPLPLFPQGSGKVRVAIGISASVKYRLAEGAFDKPLQQVNVKASRILLQTATWKLEQELIRRSARCYITNHFIPMRATQLPTYAILYDMIPVLFPKFFFADARENFNHNVQAFKNSKHIFSISEASRNDLIRTTGVSQDRVTATMIDADPVFAPKSGGEVDAVRRKYMLQSRPYILTVGTIEPRKNHARLIDAFGELSKSSTTPCDLVIVGKHGWGTDGIINQIIRLGLGGHVKILTDIPTSELPALYSGALFAVYPSLYEGFGLPVLEAMACGCPILTSDRSSMPEIAGDAALLVNPESVDAIVHGMHRLSTNHNLRRRLLGQVCCGANRIAGI